MESEEGMTTLVMVGMIIAGIVCLVLLLVIIILCCVKNKCCRQPPPPKDKEKSKVNTDTELPTHPPRNTSDPPTVRRCSHS